MMEGGGRSGSRAAAWPGENRYCNFSLCPPSSFFSISFSRLVKNFTKRNFIFPSYPSPVFARHGTAGPPYPGSSSNTYVPITFSFCLQKSSAINCLRVGKRLQKYLHGRIIFCMVKFFHRRKYFRQPQRVKSHSDEQKQEVLLWKTLFLLYAIIWLATI